MRITRKELDECIRTWNAQRDNGRHVPFLRVIESNGKCHIIQKVNAEGGQRNLCTGTKTECFEWFDAFREGYWWTIYHTDEY